ARAKLVREAYPQVLAVIGPHAVEAVMRTVHCHLPMSGNAVAVPPEGVRLTPSHYAYLKISEGCNHGCTFCVIPSLRGPLVSRPIHEVMREAETLVSAGVREIIVIAQDTPAYGFDTGFRTGFWNGRPMKTRLLELASALGELGVWIRLHYMYPYPAVDRIVELMAEGKILPYLDVPLQHVSPRILQAMRRPANSENALERIRRWRAICPDITIRSTFITGFPGETEEDFGQLLRFLEEARLDRVGAFAYSPVEGASANTLPDAVPDDLREERRQQLMELQEDISTQCLEARIGREITVLVDEVSEEEGAIARSTGDAPDIDGLVIILEGEGIEPGDFVRVRITDCDVHDLYAERLDDDEDQD
ncbi:MAG: 30S ribosomal protein S12 methylthiotransferase RimO, partial [Azoarcus sp.]|nr:30S ribosomal protein S12 methylthiotransferase RimO [Azoarcus sp.]